MYFFLCLTWLQLVFVTSNQVEIILYRDIEGDYLKNAWSALCQQYKNTVWDDDDKLCKCPSKQTFYTNPSNKEFGCYLGNEAGSCSIFLSETPSSVYLTNVTVDHPSVTFGPFDTSINGCRRPASDRWDKDGWKSTKDIKVKTRSTEVAIGFANTDIPSYVHGALFKVRLSCPADKKKCFFFKVRGSQTLTSALPPSTQPPLLTTPEHSTAPSGHKQNGSKNEGGGGMSQTTAFILGAIVAVLIVAMVIGGLFFHRKRKQKKAGRPHPSMKGSRKSNFGDNGDNLYEDIGNGLYADIGDRDLYLNPIETMKRPPISRPTPATLSLPSSTLSTENRYGGIEVRSSNPPSEATIQRFNIYQPQPSLPKGEQAKHAPDEEDERYSSLEPSESLGNINGGYVSLNRAATLEDQYVAPGHIEPPSSYQALDKLDNIPSLQPGDTYDVVGTVSMDDNGESTYDCAI